MTHVPGWLTQLRQDEAQKLCAFYARQCLAEATAARCNGYGRRPADPQDSGSWYAAARRWLTLGRALGVPACPPCSGNCRQGRDCPARR